MEQRDLFNVSYASNVTQWAAKHGLLRALLRWRAQQDSLGFLQANLQQNTDIHKGPTAFHVVNHTLSDVVDSPSQRDPDQVERSRNQNAGPYPPLCIARVPLRSVSRHQASSIWLTRKGMFNPQEQLPRRQMRPLKVLNTSRSMLQMRLPSMPPQHE